MPKVINGNLSAVSLLQQDEDQQRWKKIKLVDKEREKTHKKTIIILILMIIMTVIIITDQIEQTTHLFLRRAALAAHH